MTFGWANPFPSTFGGSPTSTQLAYEGLRGALGRGPGSQEAAGPRGGLRDAWFRCEALAIARAQRRAEHAFYQAFPQTMTSALSAWERILLIPMGPNMVARQRAVAAAHTRRIDATIGGLRRDLQAIDAAFELEEVPEALQVFGEAGKEFGPLDGADGEPYGTGIWAARRSTAWPNYADAYLIRVSYALAAGQEHIPDDVRQAAEEHLNEVLPGWVDFVIFTDSDGPDGVGFYMDGGPDDDSFMDQTGMT